MIMSDKKLLYALSYLIRGKHRSKVIILTYRVEEKKQDVFLGITMSGNSRNLVLATIVD